MLTRTTTTPKRWHVGRLDGCIISLVPQRTCPPPSHAKVVLCACGQVNYKKDGSKFCNLLRIVPVLDQNRKLHRFLGCQIDVTDVTDVAGLQRAQADLAETVARWATPTTLPSDPGAVVWRRRSYGP